MVAEQREQLSDNRGGRHDVVLARVEKPFLQLLVLGELVVQGEPEDFLQVLPVLRVSEPGLLGLHHRCDRRVRLPLVDNGHRVVQREEVVLAREGSDGVPQTRVEAAQSGSVGTEGDYTRRHLGATNRPPSSALPEPRRHGRRKGRRNPVPLPERKYIITVTRGKPRFYAGFCYIPQSETTFLHACAHGREERPEVPEGRFQRVRPPL